MGVTRLQSPATLREAIVEHLRNEIVSGSLKPGELLREVNLANQIGLSSTPIREALVQLAEQGLVEIEPNRLKRVAPMNLRALCDLVAVQRVLWQTGYSWGVPKVGIGELAVMKVTLAKLAETLGQKNIRGAFLADSEFHSIVVAASGNYELLRLISDRFSLIERLVLLYMPESISQERLRQDLVIFEALQRGDQAEALRCAEEIRANFTLALAALVDEPATI